MVRILRGHMTEGQKARVLSHAEGLAKEDVGQLRSLIGADRRFAEACVTGIFEDELKVSREHAQIILSDAAINHEELAKHLVEYRQPDPVVSADVQRNAVDSWCSAAVAVVGACLPGPGTYQPGHLDTAIVAVRRWPKAAEKALQKGGALLPQIAQIDTGGLIGDFNKSSKQKLVRLFTTALSHGDVARDFVFNHPELMDVRLGEKTIREHVSEIHGEDFVKDVEEARVAWRVDQIKLGLNGELRR